MDVNVRAAQCVHFIKLRGWILFLPMTPSNEQEIFCLLQVTGLPMSLSCRREMSLFNHSSSAFALSMNNCRTEDMAVRQKVKDMTRFKKTYLDVLMCIALNIELRCKQMITTLLQT